MRLLRLIEDRPPDPLRLLGELLLQLVERLLRLLVRRLALGEDRLRLRDGTLSFALRPGVRLVGGGLAVRLQLLCFREGGLDVRLHLVDQALDGPLRPVAGVVEALLRLVILGLDRVAHLAGGVLHFLERALAQLARGLRNLLQEIPRLLVSGLRLID